MLEAGFEQRVRNEIWDNILDFNEAKDDYMNQIRWRTRAWMKAPITHNIDAFVGLDQETWQVYSGNPHKPWRFDEVIFETGYLDFKRLFKDGLALRIGRQNLNKGEGFMLFEGGPYDGSRAVYFNAANLSYTRQSHKIELLAISNPRQDRYFPVLHDKRRNLIEWDEQALGAYYTGQVNRRTGLEAYYFYKTEKNDPRPVSDPQRRANRYSHTYGARVSRKLGESWQANGEFAWQHGGERPSIPVHGYAGYAYLKRSLPGKWHPSMSGGYWASSGDDPATRNKNEGWSPLFARWPKWSEMYFYSEWKERGAVYWTNLGMWQAEFLMSPLKWLNWRATYYHMDSFHPYTGNPSIFGAGTLRGNHYQTRADLIAGKHWRGHLLYEALLPGDFYAARGRAYFVRWEIIYALQGRKAIDPISDSIGQMLR